MTTTREKMKTGCKMLLNGIAWALTCPCAMICRLQQMVHPGREVMFIFFSQVFAMAPGLSGVYLRRAFYRQTLEHCASDVFIGFGTLFTHRRARVEAGVYIGNYAMIGCVVLRSRAMIGSRASLLSGGHLHVLDENGDWTAADVSRLEQIEIGENAWLGEAAVVMANIGSRAMVAAGAVVAAAVPARVMVAGNPARFVKRLEPPADADGVANDSTAEEVGVASRTN